ncbi:LysE family translocator [Oceanobacter mangrovi]|uniref:LysE family translocator n=1 Tax=Oceanobacter mangrovi TaxID=2862510 RepID=UPI001C8CF58C|nr:LysE family translocator [Oceanobacter mangrovi]
MISLDTAMIFFPIAILMAMAPGPDNIFVLTQSAVHGRRTGLLVLLGLCTGLMGHTAAVAMGVAAIFQTSEMAFTVLKLVGAVYLAWLAWQAFRSKAGSLDADTEGNKSACSLYLRGIVMNLTNPKVAIFFLAFLPQFVDPAQSSIAGQIIMLGVLAIIATLLVFTAIAFGASMIGEKLKRSAAAQLLLNRVAGTVFGALALKLALADR